MRTDKFLVMVFRLRIEEYFKNKKNSKKFNKLWFLARRKFGNFLQKLLIFSIFIEIISWFGVTEHIYEKKIWKNKRKTGQIAIQKMTGGSLKKFFFWKLEKKRQNANI